jgi:peptidoglycan hydrolase CwlO-like protein
MRKPVLIALIAAIVIFAVAAIVLFQKYTKTNADLMEARSGELSAQSRYTDAIGAIAEIQDSLNAIAVSGNAVNLTQGNLKGEQKLNGPSSREALDRIHLLAASIQRTKEKIHDLEDKLKKSGIKLAGLEKMITNLKSSLAEREATIAKLTGKVDSLSTKVNGLETTVAQATQTIAAKDETIEQKRREVSTVYYIIGTKKHLMDLGIVKASGGLLGLGAVVLPSGKYDETGWTGLDTDKETTIKIGGLRADLVSPQAKGSYEMVKVSDQVELHILNAAEFRKIKQVVIMTP